MLSPEVVGHEPSLAYEFREAMTECREGPEVLWCPTLRLGWG